MWFPFCVILAEEELKEQKWKLKTMPWDWWERCQLKGQRGEDLWVTELFFLDGDGGYWLYAYQILENWTLKKVDFIRCNLCINKYKEKKRWMGDAITHGRGRRPPAALWLLKPAGSSVLDVSNHLDFGLCEWLPRHGLMGPEGARVK